MFCESVAAKCGLLLRLLSSALPKLTSRIQVWEKRAAATPVGRPVLTLVSQAHASSHGQARQHHARRHHRPDRVFPAGGILAALSQDRAHSLDEGYACVVSVVRDQESVREERVGFGVGPDLRQPVKP